VASSQAGTCLLQPLRDIYGGGVVSSFEEPQRWVLVFPDLRGAGARRAIAGLRGRLGLTGRPLQQCTGVGLPSQRRVPSYPVVRRRPSAGGLLYYGHPVTGN